jgi:hypothetical protein
MATIWRPIQLLQPDRLCAAAGHVRLDHGQGGPAGTKDSSAQIAETRVFCVNIADGPMKDQMNASSAALPAGISEFQAAGIEAALRHHRLPARGRCARIAGMPRDPHPAPAGRGELHGPGVVTGIHLRDDCVRSMAGSTCARRLAVAHGLQGLCAITPRLSNWSAHESTPGPHQAEDRQGLYPHHRMISRMRGSCFRDVTTLFADARGFRMAVDQILHALCRRADRQGRGA